MKIDFEKENGDVYLRLNGRLSAKEAPELEEKIKEVISQVGNTLILDCSDLVYISSGGLRVILMATKELRKAKKGFKLINVNNDVYKILTLSGFTKIIDCSRGEG